MKEIRETYFVPNKPEDYFYEAKPPVLRAHEISDATMKLRAPEEPYQTPLKPVKKTIELSLSPISRNQ